MEASRHACFAWQSELLCQVTAVAMAVGPANVTCPIAGREPFSWAGVRKRVSPVGEVGAFTFTTSAGDAAGCRAPSRPGAAGGCWRRCLRSHAPLFCCVSLHKNSKHGNFLS